MVFQMIDEEIERLAYDATERGDYDIAVRLLEPLADKGSLYALTTLGWIYQNGRPDVLDSDLARKYYERAIALGSANACLDMGWLLIGEGKFAEARAVLEKGKEEGDRNFEEALDFLATTEAEFNAFKAIEDGNYKMAFDLLEPHKAVDSEYTLTALGWLYETGRGGGTDKDQAGSLYRRAAKIGCIDAHFRIGMLELAQGNDEAAQIAFQDGANLAHLPAVTKLAEMMIDGKGGPADVEQGMKFLTSAAEQGHIMARMKLAEIRYREEKNIIKKIFLKIKYFGIIKDVIAEAKKEARSPNIYEFY